MSDETSPSPLLVSVIRERRQKLGFSQRQMAKALEVSGTYYNRVEAGQEPKLSQDLLTRFASVTGMAPEDRLVMFGLAKVLPPEIEKWIWQGNLGRIAALVEE